MTSEFRPTKIEATPPGTTRVEQPKQSNYQTKSCLTEEKEPKEKQLVIIESNSIVILPDYPYEPRWYFGRFKEKPKTIKVSLKIFKNKDDKSGKVVKTIDGDYRELKNGEILISGRFLVVDLISDKSANFNPREAFAAAALLEIDDKEPREEAQIRINWDFLLHKSWKYKGEKDKNAKTQQKLNNIAIGIDKDLVFDKSSKSNNAEIMKIVQGNLIELRVLKEKKNKEAYTNDEIKTAVKKFQAEYKCDSAKCRHIEKIKAIRTLDGKIDYALRWAFMNGENGNIGRWTLLSMDEALVNGWAYRVLLHDSWKNDILLNDVAKGWKEISGADEDISSYKYAEKKSTKRWSNKNEQVRILQKNLQLLGLLEICDLTIEEEGVFEHNTIFAIHLFQRYYQEDIVELDQQRHTYNRYRNLDEKIYIKIKEREKTRHNFRPLEKETLLALDEALINGWNWKKARNVADEYVRLFSIMRYIIRYSLETPQYKYNKNTSIKESCDEDDNEENIIKVLELDEKGNIKYEYKDGKRIFIDELKIDGWVAGGKNESFIENARLRSAEQWTVSNKEELDKKYRWTSVEKGARHELIGLCASYVKVGLAAAGIVDGYQYLGGDGKFVGAVFSEKKEDDTKNKFLLCGFEDWYSNTWLKSHTESDEIDKSEIPIGSIVIYGGNGYGHIEIWTGSSFISDYITPNGFTYRDCLLPALYLPQKSTKYPDRKIKHIWHKKFSTKEIK